MPRICALDSSGQLGSDPPGLILGEQMADDRRREALRNRHMQVFKQTASGEFFEDENTLMGQELFKPVEARADFAATSAPSLGRY